VARGINMEQSIKDDREMNDHKKKGKSSGSQDKTQNVAKLTPWF
jgi:hypothetical protein